VTATCGLLLGNLPDGGSVEREAVTHHLQWYGRIATIAVVLVPQQLLTLKETFEALCPSFAQIRNVSGNSDAHISFCSMLHSHDAHNRVRSADEAGFARPEAARVPPRSAPGGHRDRRAGTA
jgi:hypothetical protein